MFHDNPTTIQQKNKSQSGINIHNDPNITPNNNYYNNNYNNTEPGVVYITPEWAARICKAYTDNIGVLNAAVANMIEQFVAQGLTPADIICAITETAFAPRPSAAYLRAILRNWLRDGRVIAKARHAAESDQPHEWWRAKPVHNYDDIYSDLPF